MKMSENKSPNLLRIHKENRNTKVTFYYLNSHRKGDEQENKLILEDISYYNLKYNILL